MFTAKLALAAVLGLPAYGGIIIPLSQQGAGNGYANVMIQNFTGSSICYTGYSAGNPSCTKSIASNDQPSYLSPYTGTGYASLTDYVDAKGAHITAAGDGSGSSAEEVKADAFFGDTEVNHSSAFEQFQVTFHLDAELYTKSTASDQIQLTFFKGYQGTQIFSQSLGNGGAGTYEFIHQDFTSPMVSIAPNSSMSWFVDMGVILDSNSSPLLFYAAGPPEAFIDAGNTLSFTKLAVFDAAGNPLPQSALTSGDGYDYGSTSAAPEPGSTLLVVGAGVLLVCARRKRRSRNAVRPAGTVWPRSR